MNRTIIRSTLAAAGATLALTAGLACGTAAAAPAPATPKPAVTKTVIIKEKTKVIHKTKVIRAPAAPAPVAAPQADANAEAVVDQFYQDITNQDYPDAWTLGGVNIGGEDYNSWVAGYATTASITIGTESNFNSTTVDADIIATQDDGSVNTYAGTYTVIGGVITGASITQTS